MGKLDRKKEEIAEHYRAITLNLAISFLTSVIGGLVSAILIAIAFGQSPKDIYQHIGIPLALWGCFLVVLFFIFFFIFWTIFVLIPRNKDLKMFNNKLKKENTPIKNPFNLWLVLDLFVRIMTMLAIAVVLANYMQGIKLTVFIALFILWAFRPIYLAFKELLKNEN